MSTEMPKDLSPKVQTLLTDTVPGNSLEEKMGFLVLGYLKNPDLPELAAIQPSDVAIMMTQTKAMDTPVDFRAADTNIPMLNNMTNILKFYHLLPDATRDPDILAMGLSNVDNINEQAGSLGTFGHVLARKGSPELLDVALAKGLDPTLPSLSGVDMLHVAQNNNSPQFVEKLTQARDDWKERNPNQHHPQATVDPLDAAIATAQTVGMSKEEALAAALIDAAKNNRIDTMHTLYEKGASSDAPIRMGLIDRSFSLDNPKDIITPAFALAGQADLKEDAARLLFSKSKNLDMEGFGGISLSGIAASNGNGTTIKVLHEMGVNLTKRDSTGYSPLSYAKDSRNASTLEVLEDINRQQKLQAVKEAATQSVQATQQTPHASTHTTKHTQDER